MNGARELIWWVVILMALAGVGTHWLKQIIMMRSNSPAGLKPIGFKMYWITCWPESLVALLSTIGGIAFMHESGMLTHAMSYAVGYMGNSMADMLGGRVQAMINAPAPHRE